MQTNTDMRPPTNNPELDIKTNRTSFICGNCNGHHITSYQVYKENWVKQMLNWHSEGKLCNYSKFKTNFGLEKYLCILKSFEQRRNFTRFRISSHRLQIERGDIRGLSDKTDFASVAHLWSISQKVVSLRSVVSVNFNQSKSWKSHLRLILDLRLFVKSTPGEVDDRRNIF
jgi:hypothetical protein